jgi:hypothetical protein
MNYTSLCVITSSSLTPYPFPFSSFRSNASLMCATLPRRTGFFLTSSSSFCQSVSRVISSEKDSFFDSFAHFRFIRSIYVPKRNLRDTFIGQRKPEIFTEPSQATKKVSVQFSLASSSTIEGHNSLYLVQRESQVKLLISHLNAGEQSGKGL